MSKELKNNKNPTSTIQSVLVWLFYCWVYLPILRRKRCLVGIIWNRYRAPDKQSFQLWSTWRLICFNPHLRVTWRSSLPFYKPFMDPKLGLLGNTLFIHFIRLIVIKQNLSMGHYHQQSQENLSYESIYVISLALLIQKNEQAGF